MIYLDNNSTTRPTENVVAAVGSALREHWQNPSSMHRGGQSARRAVDNARTAISELIGASAKEIVFTSGGTESARLAIFGVLGARQGDNTPTIISDSMEHSAVRDSLDALAGDGAAIVRYVTPGSDGVIAAEQIAELVDESTALVTIQWANNETGVVQPIDAIGEICRSKSIPFHSDGTQWVGKMPVSMGDTPVDLLTFSAHKFHGPKGIGALYSRRRTRLAPVVPGSQELGRRGGTENTPGILGFGAAARDAIRWLEDPSERIRLERERDRLEDALLQKNPGAVVNGPRKSAHRLWNTLNIGFPFLEAEPLLMLLSERGLCTSAGAACSSGSLEPSPVLVAMGASPEVAHGSIRLSLSRETTSDEIDTAIQLVTESVQRLRGSSSALGDSVAAQPDSIH